MFWLFLSLAINIATHWLWFFTMEPLTHADAIYILPQTFKEFLNFSIWQTNSNIGSFDFVPSFYPFNLVGAIIANLGGSTNLIQRIIFFWPIVIFGTISSYLLAYSLTKSKLGSFVASLVFNFNTFFIISSSGHITLTVAFTFFPLILYLYHKLLVNNKLYLVPITSLILFACSFWEFRAFYVISLVIVLVYVFEIVRYPYKIKDWKLFVRIFLPILLVITFNVYWILPIVTDTQQEVLSVVAGRSLFKGGTEHANMLISSFSLFHLMWSGKKIIPFSVNDIPLYFFITPMVAFSTLIFYKKNPIVLLYASLALIGILLGKFFFPPFPDLYEWLFRYVPGFGAFREPSKFTVIIYLSYSVLIAFFVKYINVKVRSTYIRYGLVIMLASVFLTNTIPIATTKAGALFTARRMPDDYKKLNQYIDEQPEFFRTLWIPRDSRWGIYTNNHPKINAVALIESKYLDKGMVGSITELVKKTKSTFMSSESGNTLDALSVKYVIIPLQDIENDDDFYQDFGARRLYTSEIQKNTSLVKKDIGLKEVLLYENIGYKEHIYSDSENFIINAKYVKPYHYSLTLNKPKEPSMIYFSESYHPGWRLSKHSPLSLSDALSKDNYFLSDDNHRKSKYSTNAYLISPSDFTGERMQLNLFFTPQLYSYVGSYISVLALVVTILGSIYMVVRNK